MSSGTLLSPVEPLNVPFGREGLEDIGYMTCMTLVLLGNYAQTGHFGGPLAYTPYNVAAHLAGPELGGLRYDYRRPKHPFGDKFMLAGGHNVPTCYALWMIMGQALERTLQSHRRSSAITSTRTHAMLPIDALGFRRGAGALKTLLADQGLADHPLFAQAKVRGIQALAGHAETIDVTNDVNGGPSGVGIATAAGKAAFWDIVGAPEFAQSHRARRRVRHDRRPRAGAQDAGARAAGGQAPAHHPLRQQRRHRRRPPRRRRSRQIPRLRSRRSVDVLRMERLHPR